jgi:hypothetical protein
MANVNLRVGDFKFDGGELTKNCALLPEQIKENITLTVDYAADFGTTWMKKAAPWHDNTSNARNGLFTATSHALGVGSTGEHRILFSHGVDYGIWLEVANQGRYQIIMPTVKAIGDQLFKGLDSLLNHPNDPMPNVFDITQAPVTQNVQRKGTSQGATVRTQRQARRVKRNVKQTARGTARVNTRQAGRNR